MKLLSCRVCGGELKKNGELYECEYCRRQYQDDTLERAYEELKTSLEGVARGAVEEAFVLAQEREIANLRKNLWKETHQRYINSRAIERICRDIKKINPDDFGALFYEVMNGDSDEARLVTEFLDEIDVFEREDYIDDVIDFVLKSLKVEYLTSLNMLVERAYKQDRVKYESVMTKIEEEAEKVESGLYAPYLSRDVFVAYSSKDMAIVNELVATLEEQGITCFVALRNLQHGRKAVENYEKALETAMDNCKIFLFVSSKNSRSHACDAIKREIPYIKRKDLEFKPEYRNDYGKMPEKYRKPRIQYRLDDVKTSATDRLIEEFFGTLQHRWSVDSVAEQIGEYLSQDVFEEAEEVKEEPKAQQPQPQQPAFDQNELYAFFRKMREEENQERRKAEERQAEERRKIEEARLLEEKKKAESAKANADFEIEYGVLKKYKGAGGDVVIPETVSTVGEYAFEACNRLTGVIIPPSVTNIRTGAFSWCTGLKSVEFSNGLREIEEYAFNKCEKLTEIEIPSRVKSIGDFAFKDCSNLRRATIPFNVANLGHAVLEGCNNVTVYAEAKAKPSGWESSWNPSNRPVVWGYNANASATNANPVSKNAVETADEPQYPDFEIENGVLEKYRGTGGNVVIPDGVTEIGEKSFFECKTLTNVVIPKTVKKIGSMAFYTCENLTEVTIPDGVTEIVGSAFQYCGKLQKISIPSTLTKIDSRTFNSCSSLSSITVEQGHSAYYSQGGCLIKKGSNILIVGGATIREIPSGVAKIGEHAFNGRKNLTSIEIPNTVTEIGSFAFSGCYGLKEVVLPSSIKRIKDHAFGYCNTLPKITIPSSVTEIEKNAFIGANKLSIYAEVSSPPVGWENGWNPLNRPVTWANGSNGSNASQTSVTATNAKPAPVPTASTTVNTASTVKAEDFHVENGVLKEYVGQEKEITVPDTVKKIGAYAFCGVSSLTSVVIPNSVTEINAHAFENSANLKSVSISDSVTKIENSAFEGCTSLTDVRIGKSVTSIGNNAFKNCKNLTEITVPEGVVSLGNAVFEGDWKLTDVKLPNSLTAMGRDVFKGCERLMEITIPKGVTEIDWSAFWACWRLEKVTFAGPIGKIERSAFYGCKSLKEITLPKSLKRIGENAFQNCQSLAKIVIPNGVEVIATDAFEGCNNLTVYAEIKRKPSGWAQYLSGGKKNPNNERPIVWGFTGTEKSAPPEAKPVEPKKPSVSTVKAVAEPNVKKVEAQKPAVITETVTLLLNHSSSPLSPANGSTYLIKIGDKITAKLVTEKKDTFGKAVVPVGTHNLTVTLFPWDDPNCSGKAIWTSEVRSITVEKGKNHILSITPYKFLGSPKVDFIKK